VEKRFKNTIMKNYKEYKYKGLTPNEEGDLIGYCLFKSGYIKEDLTEIDAEPIWCNLNKGPMKDYAKINCNFQKNVEYFISEIHYSKYGNYLGDNDEFFTT
jgi:hypothetical protein